MKTKNICICILSIALFSACKKEFNQSPAVQNEGTSPADIAQNAQQKINYAADEILIKFKKGIAEQSSNRILANITGTIKKRVLTRAMEYAGDNEGFLV